MWYVIHEYETFADSRPRHAWRVCHKAETKKEAEQKALELNFDDYCKNKVERFPKNLINKTKLSKTDQLKIVGHVMKMINSKSGSRNAYFGTGYWLSDDTRIKLPKEVHITDIHKYLIKKQSEKEQVEDEESDELTNEEYTGSDTESDTEEKKPTQKNSDKSNKTQKQEDRSHEDRSDEDRSDESDLGGYQTEL